MTGALQRVCRLRRCPSGASCPAPGSHSEDELVAEPHEGREARLITTGCPRPMCGGPARVAPPHGPFVGPRASGGRSSCSRIAGCPTRLGPTERRLDRPLAQGRAPLRVGLADVSGGGRCPSLGAHGDREAREPRLARPFRGGRPPERSSTVPLRRQPRTSLLTPLPVAEPTSQRILLGVPMRTLAPGPAGLAEEAAR
jgi:hypothetical protein